MAKWMISLDEAGTFDDTQQYFILAGIIYKEEDFESVRDHFVPLVNKLCNIIDVKELHSIKMGSSKKRFCKTVIFSHIGTFEKVKPIVYVIDKKHAKFVNKYNQKSWKYNKTLEFLYLDLIENKVINKEDNLVILLDNITLSKEEEKNLYEWLPNNYKNILAVLSGDSKDFKFIQMADMIANSFSKNNSVNLNSYDIKILNPYIEIFPKFYKDLYIKNIK